MKTDTENIYVILGNDCTVDVTPWVIGTGTFGTENTQSITIDLNGHTLTFNGIDNDWNGIYIKNEDATLTLRNGYISNSGHNDGPWNRHDINFHCKVVLENVTSDKAIAVKKDSELTNVEISDNRASDDYLLWIQACGETVTIKDCVFENSKTSGTKRGIKIADQYVRSPESVTLNVDESTFITANKAAVLVTSTAGATINWGTGNDITGVVANEVNAVWNDADRATAMDLVIVNGCK